MGAKKKHVPGCGCCAESECLACGSSTPTDQYQVDLANFANNNCLSCTNLNGTHVLDFHSSYTSGGSQICRWFKAISIGSGSCANYEIRLYFERVISSGVAILTCDIFNESLPASARIFTKNYGVADIPCGTLSAESLTRGAGGSQCANVGTESCLVTAI